MNSCELLPVSRQPFADGVSPAGGAGQKATYEKHGKEIMVMATQEAHVIGHGHEKAGLR